MIDKTNCPTDNAGCHTTHFARTFRDNRTLKSRVLIPLGNEGQGDE
jgi:hypothetical protein